MAGRWLTKREIAEYYCVGTSSIDRWCREGMPYTQMGGRRRFSVGECDYWRRSGRAGDVIAAASTVDEALRIDQVAARVLELMDERKLRNRVRRMLLRTSRPRPARTLPSQ